jgi:hypothetical protein
MTTADAVVAGVVVVVVVAEVVVVVVALGRWLARSAARRYRRRP